MKLALALTSVCVAGQLSAETLTFPSNAQLAAEKLSPATEFPLPSAPWEVSGVPSLPVSGDVTQQAWHLAAPGITSVQILRPLREQLRNAGFDILFECETDACGGFDFRFGIDVLPPPDMFVNLGDFRFLSAWRTIEDGSEEAIALLVSRSQTVGFVQLTRVGAPTDAVSSADAPALRAQAPVTDLASSLDELGHAILEGLRFERGSARLAETDDDALAELADYLSANPSINVALVGHTDAEGSLDGNIRLSKRRAASVLERLATDFDIGRSRMEAQGMGYLAPVASNQTEEGREANRRVEAIITTTN